MHNYHREELMPVLEASQHEHPGSHSHRAINPPHRTLETDHRPHPPLPSEIISSRLRAAQTTDQSEQSYHSRSSGFPHNLDPSTIRSGEKLHHPHVSYHTENSQNYGPNPQSPLGSPISPHDMSAHYHPYRSVTGTSPVSGQFLSPDYYPTQVYGSGATRRRSNSGDHRSPSPTQIKRLSDSHLRPMDYSQALPVYSRPVSPIYGGGYPSPQDPRHGSLSPCFGSYPEPSSYMVPGDNSTFVENFAVYNTGLSCTQCPYQASTSEGLQRHLQKHAKSHHCRFPNCSRTEGFATPNDRERHEKSVHKIPGQYWKCMDQQCSSYGKEFSRRDNLKDHLRRMHPVPEGMSETEANMMRSRQADDWRFEKRPSAENTPERLGSYEPLRGAGTYDAPPSSGAYYGAY